MTFSDMGIEIGLEAGGEGAEVARELDLLVDGLDVEAELAGLGGAVAAVRAGVAAPRACPGCAAAPSAPSCSCSRTPRRRR